MEKVFRDCIEGERARGRTVLLSSHILSEVEALCDRVTIIKDGHAIDTGTLAELRHLTRTHVEAELRRPRAARPRAPARGARRRRVRAPLRLRGRHRRAR